MDCAFNKLPMKKKIEQIIKMCSEIQQANIVSVPCLLVLLDV